MADPLIACRTCGTTEFDVHESYWLTGEIVAEHPGIIFVSGHADGGVEHVKCAQCGAVPESYEIQFS